MTRLAGASPVVEGLDLNRDGRMLKDLSESDTLIWTVMTNEKKATGNEPMNHRDSSTSMRLAIAKLRPRERR